MSETYEFVPEPTGSSGQADALHAEAQAKWPFFDPEVARTVLKPIHAVDRPYVHHLIVDKHMDTRKKVTLLAEHACRAFARQIYEPADGAPTAEYFDHNYYDPTKYLSNLAKQQRAAVNADHSRNIADAQLVMSEISDAVAEHERTSPIATARFIEHTEPFADQPKFSTAMMRLWYVNYRDIDLPTDVSDKLERLIQTAPRGNVQQGFMLDRPL